jgi:hypothetical protein
LPGAGYEDRITARGIGIRDRHGAVAELVEQTQVTLRSVGGLQARLDRLITGEVLSGRGQL